MPPGIEGQGPIGVNSSSNDGGTVRPAEESNDGSHKGIPVSKVGKVSKKSTAPQEGYSEKPDTLIENRDIKEEESNTRPPGRNSTARQRRRERDRNSVEKARSSLEFKNRGREIREERASVAEDSGISEDESLDSPLPSRKAYNRESEIAGDSGIDDDASSLNDWGMTEKESADIPETRASASDVQKGRPLPTLPKNTQSLKESPTPAPRKSFLRRQAPSTEKGETVQRANFDPGSKAASSVSRTETHTEKEVVVQRTKSGADIQTSSHSAQDKLLKQCQRLAETVDDLDEYAGEGESGYLEELERLETVHAETVHDDDSELEHYLASDKATLGISKGKKQLKPSKERLRSFKKSAGKLWQEVVDQAIHEKRPLHPVRQKRKAPEMDPVMAKVGGDFSGAVTLIENLKSETALSPGSQYAAAKKRFMDTLQRSEWAKERVEETLPLQQRLQTLKASVFKELNIPGHDDIEEMVDSHIRDSAYVSALEAALDTIDMMPFEARRHLEKHPALQKHLQEVHYREGLEHPDDLEYLEYLDGMERLSDDEYLEKLKNLKDPQFIRGFSDGLRLKWLAKHLSQTFRRYSNKTIGDPAFRKNMKSLLDTLNARERDIGDKLQPRTETYKEQCEELGDAKEQLMSTLRAYHKSAEDGVDLLEQRKVLTKAEALKESIKPLHDQIKFVTSYKDPEMQCAYLENECSDLDKQQASVQKSIQKWREKLDKARSKDKPLEDIQDKMNRLKRESADIKSQSADLKSEYIEFRQSLDIYHKIQFDMDIKLVNSYSGPPKDEYKSLKKQYTALDKEHASLKEEIQKCQKKLDKAKRKGESLEDIQDTMNGLKKQFANNESQSADLKIQHEELGQALKRLKKVHWVMDGDAQLDMDDDE